jgi:hypothetical protein
MFFFLLLAQTLGCEGDVQLTQVVKVAGLYFTLSAETYESVVKSGPWW